MARILLGLAVVAVVAALALCVWLTGGDPGRLTTTRSTPAPRAARALDSPVDALPEMADRASSDPRTSVDAGPTRTLELSRRPTRSFTGRVLVPDGVPADEDLRVQVLVGRSERSFGAPVAVRADGTFDVEVPRGVEHAAVDLVARWLYLEDPLRLEAEPLAYELLLDARIGGRIEGKVILPSAGSAIPDGLVGGSIGLGEPFPTDHQPEWPPRERWTEIGAELTFAFGGLPPLDGYSIYSGRLPAVREHRPSIDVRPGEVTRVELTAYLGATLHGIVVDSGGVGVGGARVRAGSSGASTDVEGGFVLRFVKPGPVELSASRRGFDAAELRLADVVDGAEGRGLSLLLGGGLRVGGRLQWPDGLPAARVDVRGSVDGARGDTARSDEGGRFELVFARGGPFEVSASAMRPELRRFDPDAPLFWYGRAPAVPGGTLDLVVTLGPAPGIEGVVVDDDGDPVTRFTIEAQRRMSYGARHPWQPSSERGSVRRRDVSDDAGHFVLPGLETGGWLLEARARGLTQTRPIAFELVRETVFVEVELAPPATVAGRVLDTAGRPIHRAKVHSYLLLDEGRWPTGTRPSTTKDGRYIASGLPPGATQLFVTAHGHGPGWSDVVVVPAGERVEPVVVVLLPGGRILGRVELPDDGDLGGLRARASAVDVKHSVDAAVLADGSFTLEHLGEGSYRVSVEVPSGHVFEVHDGQHRPRISLGADEPLEATPWTWETVEVEVPPAGEASVLLPLYVAADD